MILHITNGDSAGGTLAELFPRDTLLPWRDVLHDGPVPPGLPLHQLSEVRARFLSGQAHDYDQVLAGFRHRDATLARHAEFSETVLWFEHDLYDQLQLIQILDFFQAHAPGANLTLIQADDYLGPMPVEQLAALFPNRRAVTSDQIDLAAAAWHAFRAEDPRSLEPFLTPNAALPFLASALQRYCEEYPWTEDGLTRTQRTIARLISSGITGHAQLFQAFSRTEDPVWMGDDSFFRILEGKAQPPQNWLWDATRRRFVPRPS